MDAIAELAAAVVALFQSVATCVTVGQSVFDNLIAPLLWLLGL
jgi:hypothetical protein